MRDVNFDPGTWADSQHRLETDRKMVRRVVRLIGEIQRDPFNGIGKPDPLRGSPAGAAPTVPGS